MLTPLLIAAAVGYLLGSLPFGYLVARAKGVNIYEVGSKNPGATNVRRVLGSGPGNLVLILDAAKGAVATFAPWGYRLLSKGSAAVPATPALGATDYGNLATAGLLAAMVGHSFSCFTKFRGGKGVATGAGGFAVLFPLGAGIALVVFATALAITRYVSLASMLAAASLPFAAYVFTHSPVLTIVAAVVAAFVVFRHRANITRLRAGTESKIGQKKEGSS
ncbi:MAG: glycerol-3-phosphate 1-O-acyltransferase [Opitutus sp.]|nr:glycerol-3-phosphate 1-O-acyltransferase [Opitutus sp.]